MTNIKPNELLCYVTHQFLKDSIDNIKKAVLSSFDGEEITLAKNTLFKDHKDVLGKSVPRKDSSKRSQSVADLDDIIDALSKLDSNKNMPKYSAIEISKLPGYSVPSIQANGELIEMVHLMADKMKSMESTLLNVESLISNHLPQCNDKINSIFNHVRPTYADATVNAQCSPSRITSSSAERPIPPTSSRPDERATSISTTRPPSTESSSSPAISSDNVVVPAADAIQAIHSTFGARPKLLPHGDTGPKNVKAVNVQTRNIISSGIDSEVGDGFQFQKQETRRLRRREILVGRKQSSEESRLRGGPMPRRDYYISRLHADTQVKDMHDHLSSKGIIPIEIIDLTKEGHSLRSFKISINISDNNTFLDGDFWPFGVMIKRYFPPRSASGEGVSLSN